MRVRRAISLLVIPTLLAISSVATVAAADADTCTKGNVQGLARSAMAVAKQTFKGREHGSGNSWSCQFRLYDGNDDENNPDNPEVPDVFGETDWFLGGVFLWLTSGDLADLGWSKAEGRAFLESAVIDRLFWRSQGGTWSELGLTRTVSHGTRAPWGEVLPLLTHTYFVFEAGSLAPGTYEWRWEWQDPVFGSDTVYGEVQVLDE
jgi:hypothetical protein